MITKNQKTFTWLSRLLDLALLYVSYLGAVWLWLFRTGHDTGNITYYLAVQKPFAVLVVFCFFLVFFQYAGLYDSFSTSRLIRELGKLFVANLLGSAFSLGILFFFKVQEFSRGVAGVFFLLSFSLLALKRMLIRSFLRSARAKGHNQRNVVLVGSGYLARKYLDAITEQAELGFHCVGYVGEDTGLENVCPCLGSYEELSGLLDRYDPEEIVIALEQTEADRMKQIIADCEKQGIRTSIIPYYNDYLPACATIDPLGDVRLVNIRTIPLDIFVNNAAKRLFDILFSGVIILLLSPVYLILALGVKLSSPGPVFFCQTRVGKERKDFTMYKFRSMKVNDTSDTAWSTNRDSRITPFGAFIRKFSLDELPQFFNVLKGDMSVVGPRPELPFFVQQYRETIPRYMIKHQVKPGITGWAQVHGYRGDTSIEKRIEYDLDYIENWTFLLDIRIIFMTVFGGMMNEEKNLPWDKKDEKGEGENTDE